MKSRSSQEEGFTLIEILVVISIIAVGLSLVVLVVDPNNDRKELEREAKRFEAVLILGIDEAIFNNTEIGIKFLDNAFYFMEYDEQTNLWQPIEGVEAFNLHELPGWMEFELVIEDADIFLQAKDELEQKLDDIDPLANFDQFDEEEEPKIKPDVFILSSGEVNAFEVSFRLVDYDDYEFKVSSDDIGQVTFEAVHES